MEKEKQQKHSTLKLILTTFFVTWLNGLNFQNMQEALMSKKIKE